MSTPGIAIPPQQDEEEQQRRAARWARVNAIPIPLGLPQDAGPRGGSPIPVGDASGPRKAIPIGSSGGASAPQQAEPH